MNSELTKTKRNRIRLERAKSYFVDANNYIANYCDDNKIKYTEYAQFNDNIQLLSIAMQKVIKSIEMKEGAK